MAERDGGLLRHIGFLLLPGFSMLALFSALEPLRLANLLLGHRYHTWRIYTSDGLPARASCGMSVPADAKAGADGQDPGCVIVIAGFDHWPQPDRRLKNWLRGLDRRGVSLGAVDTGAFLLASAHLLGTVKTVVHWESADALLEMFPELTLSPKRYEIQGQRFLCVGGTAVLEMMIALLERTHGAALAARVADRLMHVRSRNGYQTELPVAPDPARVDDPDVIKAIKIMETRIESVSNIAEIASSAKLSKRTLERKFRQVLGRTPSQVYLECRLQHAQRLLRNTDLQIREVALASGFSSMSYFCRCYKQHFRRRPGSDRRLDYSLVGSGAALASSAPSVGRETGVLVSPQRCL